MGHPDWGSLRSWLRMSSQNLAIHYINITAPLNEMQPKQRKQRGKRSRFVDAPPGFFQNDDADTATDSGTDAAGSQAPGLRSMNMNTFGSQQTSRPAPRLQNTQKSALANGNASSGWAFGAPSSGGPFGGLGSAPGLGPSRPGQLSGFAQVMGGGGAQGPIDMR